MALDNFRTQKIIWDKANKKIFEAIEANAGDSNGRKLVVQVFNQETTESLSGTTLSLGWKSRTGTKGLDAFDVVDASKGIFEIYYTTEMLSNIGNLEASLILIDSTGRIESGTFTISVRPSTVDDEAVESENSFTALTEALVKVNDFESQLAQLPTQEQVNSMIGNISEGTPLFASSVAEMSDITRLYVNTSDGLIYVHDGNTFVSTGRTYQSTGIGLKVIKEKNLYSSETPVIKDFNNGYSITANKAHLFVPNETLLKGKLSLTFNSAGNASGHIYLLEKLSGVNTFKITEIINVNAVAGENYIETDIVTKGDGNEYVGFFNVGLKVKSGAIGDFAGHYTFNNFPYQNYQKDSAMSGLSGTVPGALDFAVYYTYSDSRLINELRDLKLQVENIEIPTAETRKLYTLNDAWVAWLKGEKFPIAFYNDSTTDGVNTTDYIANVLGTDTISPNAYPKLLEDKLKLETGNNSLRVYNAGFSGKVASWGVANIDNEFGTGKPYSDVKMVGIGFGINDRLSYTDLKTYRTEFKGFINQMIEWFYNKGIQPFLLTTQAAVAPDVYTTWVDTYPLRTAQHINTVANEVKRELAEEHNLELIEVNEFTEKFLLYSSHSAQTIISDKLHFGDIGHHYVADLMFSSINPHTIFVDKYAQIDYMSQSLVKGVPENKVSMPSSPTDTFKAIANYTKETTDDELIFKAHIFVDSPKKMTLKAFKSTTSSTYVKLNDTTISLDTLEKTVGTLEIGLYTIEVWTGASNQVDFKGFIIE